MARQDDSNGGRFRNLDEDMDPDLGRRGEDSYGEGHPHREQDYRRRHGRKKTFSEPRTGSASDRQTAGFRYGDERDDLRYGNLGRTSAYDDRGETATSFRRGIRESGFRGHGREEPRGLHRGKGPKNYKRADERVYDDVNRRLADDDFIDASDIVVDVKSCEVILSGTVEDRQSKRRAEDIAESVSGVQNVENRIRVHRNTDYINRDGNQEDRTMGTK